MQKPPLFLMAKPVGGRCNLRCSYCYYLEKNEEGCNAQSLIDDATLENYIRQYISLNTGSIANFIWHGGEPLIPGLDFYRKVIALQEKYAGSTPVVNTIQTNGTLLNDDWCKFFKENNWLVGISIDGPGQFHDTYRRYPGGKASFAKVMQGIELLKLHGVEWNGMAVVNSENVKSPEDFYDFFKSIGCRYMQFTPIVERRTADGHLATFNQEGTLTEESVSPAEWGEFLCRIFNRWVRSDVGRVFVQIFDATLANWLGTMPGLCSMSSSCGHAAVLEVNGDVYSCDHFVFPEYKLGNINSSGIAGIMESHAQKAFTRMKQDELSAKCRSCRFLFACHGECPKNRFSIAGNERHNYLCEGYLRYFTHTGPYMDFMAREYRAGKSPANVMKLVHS